MKAYAFPDPNQYSLTAIEASEIMRVEGCRFASLRKVQRLCREGHIDCQKITTSRNGQPIVEWLVNEASLRQRIVEIEPKYEDGDAPATLGEFSDAITEPPTGNTGAKSDHDLAKPHFGGNAKIDESEEFHFGNKGNDVTTPAEFGDAEFTEPSKAMLMIENAKLTAEIAGKSEFIDQILDDKSFLREELRDARERGRDVTKIAERMLETLETMAMGGKLERLPDRQQGPVENATVTKEAGDIRTDESERYRI